ncbi:NAD(P)H-binding protein [Planomonospora sp. ID67723]|uniref:NmrA family NAD(P)-binding protein n=1 Tax=Planomonospora sp. ID67723 TaxID=2738134 RepID=UPI0018C45091|nr:NAD(P)H-binding protein [Planomonospora sp. ID67723]MBG0830746.1 NAD(P)H-binding protein [Planomonospora sp. ID67723]
MTEKTTLVIGSNGKTGRRVADRLRERGVTVRAGSRSGNPPFDWADPATWDPALRGAESAYITYYPDLTAPGAVEAVGELARRAVGAGVRRLVLLSGRGEDAALRSEEAVRDSGAEWTVVRASWFAQNFDEGHLLEPVLGGTIALPAGEVAEPFVDAGDIADVVVAALTGDGHAGQVYEVTGPRLLTFAEAAAELSRASGREVRYVPVSADGYAATLVEYGVPAGEAEMLAGMFAEILDGRNASLGDGVQRALGRPPRDFADYAVEAAATGVWKD